MGARVEVAIEKLVHGGEGLARLPASAASGGRRQAIFVPYTLPGERVEVELDPPRRGRTTARLLAVLEPSPERTEPRCEYFGRCGGCQLQHARSAYQLELKRGILLETLQRTGGIVWTGEVSLHAGPPWGYRNRIRLHAAGAGWGYRYADSHRILPVTHCPIASARLNEALQTGLPAGAPGEEIELAVDNQDQGLESEDGLELLVGHHHYRVSPGAFFQVNRYLIEALVSVVTAGVSGTTAVDLFSGVGLFALPLSERFTRVEAVENHPVAAVDLRHNAERAGAASRIWVSSRTALAAWEDRPAEPVDLLVADPPRAGLGVDLVASIVGARRPPERIHLVSCDPATLGRDLKGLTGGGYAIESVHLFDLFPQTHHIETVVKLRR